QRDEADTKLLAGQVPHRFADRPIPASPVRREPDDLLAPGIAALGPVFGPNVVAPIVDRVVPAFIEQTVVERLLVIDPAASPGIEILERRMGQAPKRLPEGESEETAPPLTASASSLAISRSSISASSSLWSRSRGDSSAFDIPSPLGWCRSD